LVTLKLETWQRVPQRARDLMNSPGRVLAIGQLKFMSLVFVYRKLKETSQRNAYVKAFLQVSIKIKLNNFKKLLCVFS